MKNLRLSGVMILFGITLSACQTTSEPREISTDKNHFAQETNQTLENYEKAKVEYENWVDKMKDVSALQIYSKERLRELHDSWESTVDVYDAFVSKPLKSNEEYSVFSSGSYLDVYNARLSKVSEQYDALVALKQTSDDVLSSAMQEMKQLNEMKAVEIFPLVFNRLEREYNNLFTYVADNEIDEAKIKQTHFLNGAKKLEVSIAVDRYLKPLKTELISLRKEDFKEVAPISYTKALASIEKMEGLIHKDPRDTKAIDLEIVDVNFAINHLKQIGEEVKRYQSTDQDKLELLVLGYEKLFHRIAQAIEPQDLRDTSMDDQVEVIVKSINLLNNKEGAYKVTQLEEVDTALPSPEH